MSNDTNQFLSTQSIKDSGGSDLNFINKIIFYTENFKFMSIRLFVNGDWEKQLFEYDFIEKDMLSDLNIINPKISAVVHPSITVPTVMVKEGQYSMYTYYIAKTDKQDFTKTNYCWFSCDEIISMVKDNSFTSSSIYNLRRFIELLAENENKV